MMIKTDLMISILLLLISLFSATSRAQSSQLDCSQVTLIKSGHVYNLSTAHGRLSPMEWSFVSAVSGQWERRRVYQLNLCGPLTNISSCPGQSGSWFCQRMQLGNQTGTWLFFHNPWIFIRIEANNMEWVSYGSANAGDPWSVEPLSADPSMGFELIWKQSTLSPGSTDPRRSRIRIPCDPASSASSSLELDEEESYDHGGRMMDYLVVFKPSRLGCAVRWPAGLSGGDIFLIIFFSVGFLYLAIGTLYNSQIHHRSGLDALPNREFWASVPGLMQDGWYFLLGKATGRQYPVGEGGTGAVNLVSEEQLESAQSN